MNAGRAYVVGHDPDDGAPDCRLCSDEGYVNGHACDHRDTRREGVTASIVGRHVAKNWDYSAGMSINDPNHPIQQQKRAVQR